MPKAPSTANRHKCGFCPRRLPSATGLRLHIRNSPSCRRQWELHITSQERRPASGSFEQQHEDTSEDATHLDGPDYASIPTTLPSNSSDSFEAVAQRHLERFVRFYPDPVAAIVGKGMTTFELWEEENAKASRDRWYPFQSQEEWELAVWLARNVGHNQIEEFLKLTMITNCNLSVSSKYTFLQKIDALPRRPGTSWTFDDIHVVGNILGENGKPLDEHLELWRRDPVECVRELIGNPLFREAMAFSPERVYSDEEGRNRIIDEMWTAEWWWRTQGKLPPGATIAPVILASDKTKLSNFRGDQAAWPVYLSIGNIAKCMRRQVSSRATVLLGYIPISKFECFSTADDARKLAGYRTFHYCMTKILRPLVEAGRKGVRMLCADGFERRVFPIVAAYVADHPEQCLVTNVQENRCPQGDIEPNERGEPDGCSPRDVKETLGHLKAHQDSDGMIPLPHGLRPVYEPFWADLPHCDIFSCITPDILHQLHKGVFKDHLVSWITDVVGEEELDRRFKAMAHVPGIRHFKKGISHVQQWTGAEYKEMQKVFVVLVAGAVNTRVLTVVQALIDFIYHSQLHLHIPDTLDVLRKCLDIFHSHKDVFVELGIRDHFNIPKIHSMVHYVEAILEKGALDGYNTELSERLHIDFAKAGYRASNQRDYIAQMTKWLERQDAVTDRIRFLEWLEQGPLDPLNDNEGSNREEDSEEEDTETQDTRFALTTTPRLYRLAKRCPFRSIPLSQLQQNHSALDFLPALRQYVTAKYPRVSYIPSVHDTYNVYKLLKIEQPWNPFVSNEVRLEKVRATAAVASRGRQGPSPEVFDPILVIEDLTKFHTRSVNEPLAGIRAARLRVIFELPAEFGRAAHPLLYVEWYTPFQRCDTSTKLYQVSQSTRNRRPNAEVISADRVLGLCHLSGKCGTEVPKEWTSANVLDRANIFLVNPYLSIHSLTSSGLYSTSYLL